MICNLFSIVTEGKHNLLPPNCARLSQKGRSAICCRQFVLEYCRREEIRFVATNFVLGCHKRKKYDLLPPVCARLSEKGKSVITNLCSIAIERKRYDFLPQICADCHRREEVRFIATNCHQFVLDCHRKKVTEEKNYYFVLPICEEVRFVATNLCSIITKGKKYNLLPPICARL